MIALIFTAVTLAACTDDETAMSDENIADKVIQEVNEEKEVPWPDPVFNNASVHDPSIIKVEDTFYIFGSHIAAATSTDLKSWDTFTNGYTTPGNSLYGDLSENLAESFKWAGEDDADSKGGFAVWAPEIFYNEHYVNEDGSTGAYMMYYSASSTYIRSAIGFAVAQDIEGPYTYVDTLVYSGFTEEEAYDVDSDVNKKWTNTNIPQLIEEGKLAEHSSAWFNGDGSYNNMQFPNAIDANLFFDEDGRLWMTYGSWSGGIFLLELDKATGQAIYPGEDRKTEDGRLVDRYFGTKISGGYGRSGEGPYVVYDEAAGYYYLYVTYGWLGADGGYNMRLFRSTDPEGPYLDAKGKNAVLPGNTENSPYGIKLMGNFLFERQIGEPGSGIGVGYVSPGHNSVYTDTETSQRFLVFHTRFPETGEMHQVRVHQMFINKDGWPVVAPYRYAGETLEEVHSEEIIGNYKFIIHGKDNSDTIKRSVSIRLNEDNSISGNISGTWELSGENEAEIVINGITYDGVFVRQWDPIARSFVMAFTAISEEGVTIWGSKVPERTVEEVVSAVYEELSLGNTNQVTANLNLPTEGVQETAISWETSDSDVISNDGKISRPAVGSDSETATLTATITNGEFTETKNFEITVLPLRKVGLAAHYNFNNNLEDSTGNFDAGVPSGDRINNSDGSITFAEGKFGEAAVFDGLSGILLPEGLISNDSYSVSLWVKPDQLTPFTTTFFGGMDENNWVSLVPSGPVDNSTMVWSGSERWYDAVTGITINPNEWTHLAFTVDKGSIYVYVNGEEMFSGTDFPHIFKNAGASFALGVNWWDAPYRGLMDDLRIYEGALLPTQIEELVNIN